MAAGKLTDSVLQHPRDMLRKLHMRPKYNWGQNFLCDEMSLECIADEALLKPGECCMELGAGLGHLTRQLLATGAAVTAVELDAGLADALRRQKLCGLTLLEADVSRLDFARAAKSEQLVLVGNLPYHLTSLILFQLLNQVSHIPRAVFTLQKEVATRLAALPGGRNYGVLTVLLGLYFAIQHCFDVPAAHFYPMPAVDSAVLKLTRRPKPLAAIRDASRFQQLVKASFAQRRKTLINSLKGNKFLASTEDCMTALTRAGIDGKRRAESLSIEEFARLERMLPPAQASPQTPSKTLAL